MNFKNYLFIYIFLGGCVTTPKILFEDPVDTKNKRISIQEKKIFSFERFGSGENKLSSTPGFISFIFFLSIV